MKNLNLYSSNAPLKPEILSSFTLHSIANNFGAFFAVLSLFLLPISTSLLYGALGFVILGWIMQPNLKEKCLFSFYHPASVACLTLFALFLIGALYSQGPNKDIFSGLSKMSKLLYVPFLLPFFAEKKWRDRGFYIFILAMLLSLGLGLLKFTTDFPPLYLRHTSPATVFKSYIDTNLMMAFSVFVLAHIFTKTQKLLPKILCATLMLLMTIYVLWWSEGRSGYFVFIALWLLFSLQIFRLRYIIAMISALILLLGFAAHYSPTFRERLWLIPQHIQDYHAGNQFTSEGQRIQYYKNTFIKGKEKFWLGWGTGSYKSIYGDYAKQHQLFKTGNPHNEYLNIFFQLGLLGVVGFIGMLLGFLYLSFKLPVFEGYVLQGICLAMGLGCLGNSWLMDFTTGFWFILMVALCASAYPSHFKKKALKKDFENVQH